MCEWICENWKTNLLYRWNNSTIPLRTSMHRYVGIADHTDMNKCGALWYPDDSTHTHRSCRLAFVKSKKNEYLKKEEEEVEIGFSPLVYVSDSNCGGVREREKQCVCVYWVEWPMVIVYQRFSFFHQKYSQQLRSNSIKLIKIGAICNKL